VDRFNRDAPIFLDYVEKNYDDILSRKKNGETLDDILQPIKKRVLGIENLTLAIARKFIGSVKRDKNLELWNKAKTTLDILGDEFFYNLKGDRVLIIFLIDFSASMTNYINDSISSRIDIVKKTIEDFSEKK